MGPPGDGRQGYALDPNDIDFSKLTDQRIINWTLNDVIQELFRLDAEVIYFGTDAPEEPHDYKFWWDTERLELTIWYNDQWWPVAIPPAQAETLRQEIDALYADTTANRLNIAITQQELDLKVLETKERIDEVEETANDAKAAADAATNNVGNAVENAAFVNQNNTFASNRTNTFKGNLESDKQLTITAPSNTNYNPTFQIKGTARTGTVNSVVLRATQSNARMRVTYRGPIDTDDEIVTKAYTESHYGVPYVYKDTSAASLNSGEFTIDSSAHVYFHPYSANGNELVANAAQTHSNNVAGVFKAYDSDGDLQYMMAFMEYSIGQTSNNHAKLHKNHTFRGRSLTDGQTYYLADGFLLPY